MSIIELLLIGIGLSMDAFAVAICKGLAMRRINYRHTLIIALSFGGFQALMPYIGWLLGSRFARYITPVRSLDRLSSPAVHRREDDMGHPARGGRG